MTVVIVLALYIMILCTDIIPAWRSRKWPVAVVASALFAVGLVIQVLYELGINVPSPAEPISNLVNSYFNLK